MDWFKANDLPVAPHLPTSKRLVDFYGFAIRRQERFLARVNGTALVSEDPILDKWKFTNAYRILDRVSQYMAKNIIDDRANRFFFFFSGLSRCFLRDRMRFNGNLNTIFFIGRKKFNLQRIFRFGIFIECIDFKTC